MEKSPRQMICVISDLNITAQDNEQWTQLLATVEVSVDHFYIKC